MSLFAIIGIGICPLVSGIFELVSSGAGSFCKLFQLKLLKNGWFFISFIPLIPSLSTGFGFNSFSIRSLDSGEIQSSPSPISGQVILLFFIF